MKKNKTQIVKKKIISRMDSLDIAWYLVEDIKWSLKLLHFYKLKNMFKNIDDLVDYLYILDKQNTNQIKNLCEQNNALIKSIDKNNYYISTSWLEEIWIDKNSDISTRLGIDYQLQSTILSTKWLLLLTLNEFCNATNTRIYLNRVMWQRQLEKKSF